MEKQWAENGKAVAKKEKICYKNRNEEAKVKKEARHKWLLVLIRTNSR